MAYFALSAGDRSDAIRLNFRHYDATSTDVNWDNVAVYSTRERVTFTNPFVITLTKGATYDFLSTSYSDPMQLSLHDFTGKLIRVDQGYGDKGMDVIVGFVPEYTGDYYIDASWWQGFGENTQVAIGVFEDVDTNPDAGPRYGTAGIDQVLVQGSRANYDFSLNGEKVDLTQRGQPVKQYVGIERFRFDDISIATDISGNAGKAYRLYEAAFDRKPDASGLGFWINGLDHGITLHSIATSFLASAEFKSRYGDEMSQKDYVTALYLNVLNRAPDQAGTDFWVNALNSGSSRAQVLVNFSESIENQQGVIGAIQNGMEYQFFV